ncbi:hypothetical protein RJ639_035264 [Escallonia herrerae]|uniref:Peripheral subunit-binding (PSBD) domain-containing protein n=1 Tax=Escallonia herrerae TaxID=1293975 RepID=A0AA89BGV4_9ASTE|nr:hypothetical protein RJ639_035264 [Escallonia herrerae]
MSAPSGRPKKIMTTPFAKKLAKQHKVDINLLVGMGPFGRIMPADVEAAAEIKPENSRASCAEFRPENS